MTVDSSFEKLGHGQNIGATKRTKVLRLLRFFAPLVVVIACLVWIAQTVPLPSWEDLRAAWKDISAAAWLMALFWTAISFWAVGGYDGIWHRTLKTGIAMRRTRIAGMAAVGLGQATGASALVGSLLRWRLLPSLGVMKSGAMTASVAISFILAWGTLTAITLLVLGLRTDLAVLSIAFLIGIAVLLTLGRNLGTLRFFGRTVHIPTLRACAQMLALTALDTAAAALALFALMPDGIAFADLFALYLLGLGAALISNTPAGIGPFDLALLAGLAALPTSPDTAQVVASLLAFRLVYYALPAGLAVGVLVLDRTSQQLSQTTLANPSPKMLSQAAQAKRSETLLMRAAGSKILTDANGAGTWLARPLRNTLAVLFDPITDPATNALTALDQHAKAHGYRPFIYKCNQETAATARRLGWTTMHISDEAETPTHPAPDMPGPEFRQVRRKLRKAKRAAVSVRTFHSALPHDCLQRVASDWVDRNKNERGFSMGRMDQAWLSDQLVLGAYYNQQMVGFVSFHTGHHHWTLDLVRIGTDAPDGTAHTLIVAALDAAKQAGLASISLAAAPRPRDATASFLQNALSDATKGDGLRQFKQAFAPDWQPLYACAPSRWDLFWGGVEVTRHIHKGETTATS
ncbi:phosphatidylglycerol lysyltransferase domain-containing protein [Nereida sp. MMG025]|uniref:phosphatidylglycerol lysyltransferase domain-containing protein n=1 Tax=Nereida sp. MMG025 TaxID=2909981 RepID=UPI001F3E504F|nr:phosphatidylglycerol lysyltransferase domain-containing protein [Nereida sp. MMG025]MCF6443172.1 phosphatidylglycerol lysyltransferase domain-containing protein [Nereida sp. MMG025]